MVPGVERFTVVSSLYPLSGGNGLDHYHIDHSTGVMDFCLVLWSLPWSFKGCVPFLPSVFWGLKNTSNSV